MSEGLSMLNIFDKDFKNISENENLKLLIDAELCNLIVLQDIKRVHN